jgi:hypothetical protein
MLAQTGCLRVVVNRDKADLIVVGQAGSEGALGAARTLAQVAEGLTLMPLFGMPVPGRVRGWATASLYTRDGELVGSLATEAYLSGWTTLYTVNQDRAKAFGVVRGMAMHDLAEHLAASVCRS